MGGSSNLMRQEQVKKCKGSGITEDGAGQGGDEEDREIKGLTGLTEKNTHSCKSTSEHLIGIMRYLRIMV